MVCANCGHGKTEHHATTMINMVSCSHDKCWCLGFKENRPTPRAPDEACTCGKSILGEIDADQPCPVAWHNPLRR